LLDEVNLEPGLAYLEEEASAEILDLGLLAAHPKMFVEQLEVIFTHSDGPGFDGRDRSLCENC
jgi:hypothetical protein